MMLHALMEALHRRLPRGAREAGVVFVGDVFSKFLTFLITLSMFALLQPHEYLLYGLFITVLAAINQFTDSGLHQSFIRFYALYKHSDSSRAQAYFQFTFRLKAGVVLCTSLLLYVSAEFLAVTLLRAPELERPLRVMTLAVVGGGIMEFILAVLQARQEFVRFTIVRVSEAALKTGLVYAVVFAGVFSLELVYCSYALAPLLIGLAAAVFVSSLRKSVRYDWKDVGREMLAFGKWMMLTSFATMFLMRLDVFMVSPLLSDTPAEAGLYIAAVKLCTPLIVLAGSVSTVFFPKAMELRSTAEMLRYLKRTLAVSIPVTGIGLLYLICLFLLVPAYFPAYEGSLPLFAILFIGYAWTIVGNPITMLILSIHRARAATFIALGQLALTTCSHYYFITTFGSMGAAVSSVLLWFLAGIVTMSYIYINRYAIETVPKEKRS